MVSDTTSDTTSDSAMPASGANPVTDLVIAVVQNEDSRTVADALLAAGYRLTHVNSAVGLLRHGNITLLIAVDSQQVEDVLALIHANCRPRTEQAPLHEDMPMHGATVYVLEAQYRNY